MPKDVVSVRLKNSDKRITLIKLNRGRDDLCNKCCPYGSLNNNYPSPECPENKDVGLCDWCSSLPLRFAEYVPKEGEIERILGDKFDLVKRTIDLNSVIRVSDFVDSVCVGFCDLYTKDHSNCSSKNNLCILKDLLREKNGQQ